MITSLTRIDWLLATGGNPCFGITEAIFGTALSSLLGGGLAGAGIGAETAGALGVVGADAIGGAAAGAGLAGVEGQPLGTGALEGAVTGGAGGAAGAFGPAIADATGLPATGVEAGIGAAGGVLGASLAGSSPLTGALAGGVGGVAAGLTTPTATPSALPTGSPIPPGAGASAAGIAGGSDLTGDPAAFLTGSGGTNFVGASSGAPVGVSGAAPSSAVGLSGDAGSTTGGATGVDFGDPSGMPGGSGGAVAATGGSDFSSATSGGSGVSDFFSKHWPQLASAGIIGYEALTKNQGLPQETQLQGQATTAATQSAALEAPLQTGILPPGAKQSVDAATAASKAGIKSTYANLGLSGSTMEAGALGAVDRNAAAQTFQIADQLLAKGIDLSKLSSQDLQYLIDEQLKQDNAFTGALSTFAGGLAGGKLAG